MIQQNTIVTTKLFNITLGSAYYSPAAVLTRGTSQHADARDTQA